LHWKTLWSEFLPRRDDLHRDRSTMKAPVVLVAAALTVAILLTASFLIATGTRGENALRPLFDKPAGRSLRLPPAADDTAAPEPFRSDRTGTKALSLYF
jgi:hypothetical protein